MASIYEADYLTIPAVSDVDEPYVPAKEIPTMIQKLKKEMKEAAGHLEFERAAEIRDKIQRLEEMELKVR
jgi:excinuclease ABC subunit B